MINTSHDEDKITMSGVAYEIDNMSKKFKCEFKGKISVCAGLINIQLSAEEGNIQEQYEMTSMNIFDFNEKKWEIYKRMADWFSFYFTNKDAQP